MLPCLQRLHRIEELLLDDLSILNRVETCFVHGHAFPRVFRRDVILESYDEAVAMGERSFGYVPMDFVVIHPPLILAFNIRDPPSGSVPCPAWRRVRRSRYSGSRVE